ncbi:Uncharacterised protein [Mycobacteroides abscessus subsp. abscessus]|nr:Uncharacterised protein [Mycobacteroides abscessus subsp. abscessus]
MSFSSTPGTSRAILYCLSVSWMSSAGFSIPGQSDGQRGMASVGKPKPRNASSNRRSISRCNCRMGLTGPPATCRSLRCTGSEAVLCCSSCSFLNQFQGANFLKSMSMSHLQKKN